MTHDETGLHSGAMDSRTGTVRSPLLIGRDDLLELVDRRLDDVVAGRGQFLLVAGEAGIGKSRLLDAVRQKASERGMATFGGALAPQDRDVPAASILDLGRSLLRDPTLADLGRTLIALPDTVPAAGLMGRRRLVLDIVDRMLAGLPDLVSLEFDDLHWADDISLEIIAELARRSRDRGVLLAGGYRTDEAPLLTSLRDWRSRLLTQRIAEELRLGPLSATETALVTTLILDTGLPAPREVAAAVHARTDGIPLHIEELLGALGASARASGAAIREAVVPETIEDAVISRVGHRSPEAQAAARAGAVIGRCFTAEVLAGIMDLPVDALDAPLQELVEHFVLEPSGSRGLFDFHHQLLRDALYRSVTVGDRRRFHARAAEFGARLEGHSEIHASAHFERAGLRERAFETALAGARDVARLSAHREAFELYRRAVDNMPTDLPDAERARILEAYSVEAESIEENDIAERIGTEAAAAHRSAGEPARAILAMEPVYSAWRRAGRPVGERIARMTELMAELDGLPPGTPDVAVARLELSTYLAIALIDSRRLPEARAVLASARAIGHDIGDPTAGLIADWWTAMADFAAGDIEGAVARVAAVAVDAERAGHGAIGVSAFRDAGTLAVAGLRYDAASQWIGEGLRYADSMEQSHCAHVMSANSAIVAWATADWTAAAARAEQAVADKGCQRAAAMARWALGYVLLGRGDLDGATAVLSDALAFGERSEEIGLILPPLWGLAETALLEGDPERAFALCQDAHARATADGERALLTPFVVTGVRAAQGAGRPADGATWLAACAELLGSIPAVAGAALAHGRGLVALADGATGVARIALEAAVAGWDEHERAWEATWARLDLAHCCIRSTRFAEAVGYATDARSTALRLDSLRLVHRAEELQRMARGHAPDDEPWRPLTAREFEVARLVSEGRTNAEIADSLGIAPKTASSHVEHILAKLGASRRTEIATWASHVPGVGAPT